MHGYDKGYIILTVFPCRWLSNQAKQTFPLTPGEGQGEGMQYQPVTV